MSKTENLQKIGMFMLLWLVVFNVDVAYAQRGGFSPDRIFDFMDSDKNGRLDAEEIERSRGPFKDMLQQQGIDYRRGLDRNGFSSAFERMRQQRESQSGDRGSDRGGSDRRSRGDDRSRDDRSREDDRRSREDSDRRRREEDDRRRSSESSRPTGPVMPVLRPKERVTVDIPSSFTDGDTDGDGQIGFYEWKKWKRESISEFARYDRNNDGFLTPKELVKGPSETVMAVATVNLSSQSAPGSSTRPANSSPQTATSGTESSTASTSSSSTSSSASSSVDTSSVAGRRAESMFRLLDRNRDDQLADDEWQRARTIKPLFEQGGIDLSKPMSKNDFLENYIRLSGT